MSPLKNKYCIGIKENNDFALITKDPIINLKQLTVKERIIYVFTHFGKPPKQIKIRLRYPDIIVNPTSFVKSNINTDTLPEFYNSEREANNKLIEYNAKISWFLKQNAPSLPMTDFPLITEVKVYKVSDVLPELVAASENIKTKKPRG